MRENIRTKKNIFVEVTFGEAIAAELKLRRTDISQVNV